jgi:hypothetical protein
MGDSSLFVQFVDPKELNLSKEINNHVFSSITDNLLKKLILKKNTHRYMCWQAK